MRCRGSERFELHLGGQNRNLIIVKQGKKRDVFQLYLGHTAWFTSSALDSVLEGTARDDNIIRMNLVRSLHLVALADHRRVRSAQTVASRQQRRPPPESTAELIKVSSEIKQLQKLSASTAPADRWQILWLHQHISEQVMAASLQVDATTAQIDNEIARANEVRGYLADRRDRAVSRTNLLSVLVGGAVGATSSGLQLSSNLTKPAAGVGIGAGTLSAGLALTGIHQQKGKTSPFDFDSNMLAEFFDRPTLPNSQYPSTIWIFLNEASPYGAGRPHPQRAIAADLGPGQAHRFARRAQTKSTV